MADSRTRYVGTPLLFNAAPNTHILYVYEPPKQNFSAASQTNCLRRAEKLPGLAATPIAETDTAAERPALHLENCTGTNLYESNCTEDCVPK